MKCPARTWHPPGLCPWPLHPAPHSRARTQFAPLYAFAALAFQVQERRKKLGREGGNKRAA